LLPAWTQPVILTRTVYEIKVWNGLMLFRIFQREKGFVARATEFLNA
jgi:uncharacterized protein (DUF2141 family)